MKRHSLFRPYALSIAAEAAGLVLECDFIDQPVLRWMQTVWPVRPGLRAQLRAGVHVDGTTRPQLCWRHDNPLYWEVLVAFGRRTGLPAVLNTSFNERSKPIVTTAVEALEIILLTQAAVAFQKARLPSELRIEASLLHNLASAAAPDSGTVTPEQSEIGRNAAIEALALRRQLGNDRDIGMTEYMVGVYQYRDKKFSDAEQTFSSAREKLASIPESESYAWVTLFLGYSELALGNNNGQTLIDQAKSIFVQLGSSLGQRYVQSGIGKG